MNCLVVDDHPLYRQGLSDALSHLGEISGVTEFSSVESALGYEQTPDVILLDLGLPGLKGPAAVEAILNRWPSSSVLVITASEAPEDVVECVAAGAAGYLAKSVELPELAEAFKRISAGELYVTPRLAEYLLELPVAGSPEPWSLTEREEEVLRHLASGLTDKQIAAKLVLSPKTVQRHLERIRDKTGLRRRAHLTRLAVDRGLIDPLPD